MMICTLGRWIVSDTVDRANNEKRRNEGRLEGNPISEDTGHCLSISVCPFGLGYSTVERERENTGCTKVKETLRCDSIHCLWRSEIAGRLSDVICLPVHFYSFSILIDFFDLCIFQYQCELTDSWQVNGLTNYITKPLDVIICLFALIASTAQCIVLWCGIIMQNTFRAKRRL